MRKEDRKSRFQKFIEENYFDAEAFFKSVAIPESLNYLYFGDLQTNLYYISDNMRDDFGFPGNVVYNLVEKWAEVITDPLDNDLFHQDMEQVFSQKKDLHSLRYRVTDKSGNCTWVHCRGILKWSPDKSKPLFFSGCISKLKNDFSLDSVTGFLREQAALNELASLEEGKRSARIVGFGLNHFTYINESRGRLSGDLLLRSIAFMLQEEMGREYTFYRLDGVRFMAIPRFQGRLPESDKDEEAVDRIRRIIEKCYTEQKLSGKQAASFGVIHFPDNSRAAQEILENTMMLISVAKMSPELKYTVFSHDIIERQKDKSRMAVCLNRDVEAGCENFRIMVQPIVTCADGRIIGGEVLLRWKYENGRDISPVLFIPLLEKSGMILPAGKWVFEQTVKTCGKIIARHPDFLLSFNVSYLQILDDSFLPFLKETMEQAGLPGKNLMLELTETHFDEMPKRLQQFVSECQKLGIRFALDDFGNGFSSLQMLFRYPVNVVKLDRTLMSEMTHSDENLDFIMSIIYACHRSGKQVCVEGVETDFELNGVRRTDCDMIQGFYFYRPLELPDLFEKLGI